MRPQRTAVLPRQIPRAVRRHRATNRQRVCRAIPRRLVRPRPRRILNRRPRLTLRLASRQLRPARRRRLNLRLRRQVRVQPHRPVTRQQQQVRVLPHRPVTQQHNQALPINRPPRPRTRVLQPQTVARRQWAAKLPRIVCRKPVLSYRCSLCWASVHSRPESSVAASNDSKRRPSGRQ